MSEHVYLSTACLHDLHAHCRVVCKWCPAACNCGCHHPDPTKETAHA